MTSPLTIRPADIPPAARNAGPGRAWRFAVWLQPGAARDRVAGTRGDALKVAVSAPPEKGKANRALRELLSAKLGVRASGVRIVKGRTARLKEVVVSDVTEKDIWDLLAGPRQ